MNHRNTKLLVQRAPWAAAIEFLVTQRGPRGEPFRGEPVEMVEYDERLVVDPTFRLEYQEVQFLMDELWRLGYRPTDAGKAEGALQATERHLEDMRRIVLNFIGLRDDEN